MADFTMAQLQQQYARNAEGLRALLTRAEASGRKANGFTAEQLRERIAHFERMATVPPYEVRRQLREATLAIGRKLRTRRP